MAYLRHPKTTNEKRAWGAYEEWAKEYGFRLKRRRSPRQLVDAYDDIFASYWGHRSWKRNRRTKWKPKR